MNVSPVLRWAAAVIALSLSAAVPAGATESLPEVWVDIRPTEARVGDQLDLRVNVTLPPGVRLEASPLGPQLGPFEVVEGGWSGPRAGEAGELWSWNGRLATYRTGSFELPSLKVVVRDVRDNVITVETDPVAIEIRSVLEEQSDPGGEVALADLKSPAGIEPEYGPLFLALGILALLLAVSAVLWWLQRRYAARLASVAVPEDPFHRTPPDVWVYAELQKLLERRLAERGEVELFFSELARILKRYLAGRYRIDLMERTSSEVPAELRQAGASQDAIGEIVDLFRRSDMAKFAQQAPLAAECKTAIEQGYRIVDRTKPCALEPAESERGAA